MLSLFAALALSACGGDTGTVAPDASGPDATTGPSPDAIATTPATADTEPAGVLAVDACSLLLDEEIAPLFGGTAPAGVAQDMAPVYACRWESGVDRVDVSVVVFPDNATAIEVAEDAISTNGYPRVDGLGDVSYDAREYGFGLNAVTSRFEVGITIYAGGAEDDFDTFKDFMTTVFARLPS